MATNPRKQVGGVVKFDHSNFNEIGSRIRPPDTQISSKSDYLWTRLFNDFQDVGRPP